MPEAHEISGQNLDSLEQVPHGSLASIQTLPDYQQGVDLGARIIELLRTNSPAFFDDAIDLFTTFRVHHEAAKDLSTAATALFKNAEENYNKTLRHATDYRDQLYARITELNALREELNTLRHQLRATSEASHGYYIKRKEILLESRALHGFLCSITETREKMAVWDRRVENRRQELRALCQEMETRLNEFDVLNKQREDIQTEMNALEESIGPAAAV